MKQAITDKHEKQQFPLREVAQLNAQHFGLCRLIATSYTRKQPATVIVSEFDLEAIFLIRFSITG